MKTNSALQVIFAFFLGLVVVAFVGIGVDTFYPEPGNYTDHSYANWRMVTGIIVLICATVILVISLLLPEHQAVISNGVLLGGVFTMIYAVGVATSSGENLWRFIVVTIALLITVAVGYLKFVQRRQRQQDWAPPEAGELVERITVLEHKLDALGRALRD